MPTTTANLKLPTKRCGAVGIPPAADVGGGQLGVSAFGLVFVLLGVKELMTGEW